MVYKAYSTRVFSRTSSSLWEEFVSRARIEGANCALGVCTLNPKRYGAFGFHSADLFGYVIIVCGMPTGRMYVLHNIIVGSCLMSL